jgi:gliding motility-associated lipoprotein GldH
MHKRILFALIFFASLIFLVSCSDNRVYDTMSDISESQWTDKQDLTYNIDIKDTSARYSLYYLVRYNNDNPYYNLYVTRYLHDSSDKFISKKLQGMDLFDPKNGMPYGSGLGTYKDYEILSEDKIKFPYAGNYKIKIKQYMRQDTIIGIKSFGVKIETLVK